MRQEKWLSISRRGGLLWLTASFIFVKQLTPSGASPRFTLPLWEEVCFFLREEYKVYDFDF